MSPPFTRRTEESLRTAARRTSRLRRVRHEVIEGLNEIHLRSGWSGCRSPPPLPRLPQAQTRVHALRGSQARCLTRHQTCKRQTARQLLASRRRPRCSQSVGNDPPSLGAATLDDACVGSSSGATSTITSRRTTAPVTSQSPTRRLRTQLSARASSPFAPSRQPSLAQQQSAPKQDESDSPQPRCRFIDPLDQSSSRLEQASIELNCLPQGHGGGSVEAAAAIVL
jgi:hypothetical protein